MAGWYLSTVVEVGILQCEDIVLGEANVAGFGEVDAAIAEEYVLAPSAVVCAIEVEHFVGEFNPERL